MTPSVTIDLVICTYNNAPLLDRALAAISRQEVPPDVRWSVLVVENNCTDETPAVVARYMEAGQIPSLSWVSEPRQGLTYARLCGVCNTTSPWIAFVDDDCLLRKDWVAQATRFAQTHPDCGGFGGKVILDWEVAPPAYVLNYSYAFAEQNHGLRPRRTSYLVGAGLVVRRKALHASGWTQEQFLGDRVGRQLVSGGDMEITLRIHAAGHALWYTPACELMHYVPRRRMRLGYLIAVNYGLGTSQQYVDALRWPDSETGWLRTSLARALRSAVRLLRQTVTNLVRSQPSTAEAMIDWSFIIGRWAGIAKLVRMSGRKRRALLGCAADTAAP